MTDREITKTRVAAWERLRHRVGIPDRCLLMPAPKPVPQADTPTVQSTLWRLTAGRRVGETLVLCGECGVGKTQIAAWAATYALWRAVERTDDGVLPVEPERVTLFTDATDMLLRLRDSQSSGQSWATWNEYRSPMLLIIDGLQCMGGTEWEARTLTGLISHRYSQRRDTIITTNDTKDRLPAILGPDIVSRMGHAGGVIECRWPSFRSEKDLGELRDTDPCPEPEMSEGMKEAILAVEETKRRLAAEDARTAARNGSGCER